MPHSAGLKVSKGATTDVFNLSLVNITIIIKLVSMFLVGMAPGRRL